jgi:hypothetical protein
VRAEITEPRVCSLQRALPNSLYLSCRWNCQSLSLLLFVCRSLSLGGNMNFPAQNSRPLERERLAATLTSVYILMRHIVCQIRVQNELFAARPAPTQTEENYSCCRGCLLVRRLIVFSTSMKWKRVIIQGNQQPRHGSMFSEHARLALRAEREREKCAMSHKRVRQVLGAAESNFLGVGGLLIY